MTLNNVLRSESITVALGATMTITTNALTPQDYGTYVLLIGTAFPTYTGTEAVSLSIGGVTYPLIDNAGNIVVAGKLRDGKLRGDLNISAAKYRLQFGSNGMPTAIPHFVVHEGLCPMIYNGTAGSNDNTTTV